MVIRSSFWLALHYQKSCTPVLYSSVWSIIVCIAYFILLLEHLCSCERSLSLVITLTLICQLIFYKFQPNVTYMVAKSSVCQVHSEPLGLYLNIVCVQTFCLLNAKLVPVTAGLAMQHGIWGDGSSRTQIQEPCRVGQYRSSVLVLVLATGTVSFLHPSQRHGYRTSFPFCNIPEMGIHFCWF